MLDKVEARRAYHAAWRARNKERVKAGWKKACKKWRDKNPEKHRAGHDRFVQAKPERVKELNKQWFQANKSYRAEYVKTKRDTDLQYKLRHYLRSRICSAIRDQYRKGSAVRDLGCTILELIAHLEKQFKPGMTWKNYGEWHIDHIMPLASFNLEDRNQFLEACHFSNLQPLWAEENLRKGTK